MEKNIKSIKNLQDYFLDQNYYSTHEDDKIVSDNTIPSSTILPIDIDADLETICHMYNNKFTLIPMPETKRTDVDKHGMKRYLQDFICMKSGTVYRNRFIDLLRNGLVKKVKRKEFSNTVEKCDGLSEYINNYYDMLPMKFLNPRTEIRPAITETFPARHKSSLNISKELLFFKLDHFILPKLVNRWNQKETATLINLLK